MCVCLGPSPGCADPANAMGSLRSEYQKEDAAVEHVYCRGAVTELLKYGHRDLHTTTKNSNSPQVLILIIPGMQNGPVCKVCSHCRLADEIHMYFFRHLIKILWQP